MFARLRTRREAKRTQRRMRAIVADQYLAAAQARAAGRQFVVLPGATEGTYAVWSDDGLHATFHSAEAAETTAELLNTGGQA